MGGALVGLGSLRRRRRVGVHLLSCGTEDHGRFVWSRQLDTAGRQEFVSIRKYRRSARKLADSLEANVAEGLAVFALPRAHRRRLRTSNMRERLSEELKRRRRVAGLFPNGASVLRLVSAVLMEISEDWETNRKYLTVGPE